MASSLCASDALHRFVEVVAQQNVVGDEAMHLAHVDRVVHRLAAAALVARMLADPAGRTGQRVVHDDGLERFLQPAFLVELQEARDVHVQRAAVLAGRQRQFGADAGHAAMGDDVVFELLAEVPHGGQHRVGRRLAQAAQRAVADVAAQLVQPLQVVHAARALGDAVQDAQTLVQSDAAGNAFAARLGVGELDEVAGDVDHAVVFVHHHHAAGAHDGAQLRQAFVVHRGVEHLAGDAAAGRASGLHRLDGCGRRRRLRRCRR